ncbi:MAG: hypothetical protein ABFD89_01565 [Bryobacteraceae bacterium]
MRLSKHERRKARKELRRRAQPKEINGVLIASRMIEIAGRHGAQWAARLLMGQISVEGEQRLARQAEAELREEMKSER